MAGRDGFYKRKRIWWCSTDPITGRAKTTRCTDLEAAKAWRRQRERMAHDPAYARESTATFGEWATRLITMKSQKLKPISVRAYPKIFGHWVRLIPESTVLAKITPGTYDEYIAMRRNDGVTDYTIGKEITAMTTLLRFAKRAGCYPGDPSSLRPIDFVARYVSRSRALTPPEFTRLMYQLSATRQAFVCVCVALGCRRSEALRMLPTDIGQDEAFIGGTKTEEARRTVPILSVFRPLIELARPYLPLPDLHNIHRDLWKACDDAGIERVSPNDLRRTHATWLKEAGVDSDTVRRLLGHTTTGLVDRVYGRPRVEKLAELAEARLTETTHGRDSVAIPEARKPNTRRLDALPKAPRAFLDESAKTASSANTDVSESIAAAVDRQNPLFADLQTLHEQDPEAALFAMALAEHAERALAYQEQSRPLAKAGPPAPYLARKRGAR